MFEEDRSTLYMLGWLVVGWVVLVASNMYLPPATAQVVGGAGYLTAIIGGVFGTTAYLRLVAAGYPYIQAVIRPDNKKIHMFIDPPMKSVPHPRIPNYYSTYIDLHWPVKLPNYGRVKTIVINHELEWTKRVRYRPGTALLRGIAVGHPQTEYVELYQTAGTTHSLDHNEPVPVFILKSASLDYYTRFTSGRVFGSGNPGGFEVAKLKEELELWKNRALEAERDALRWHQEAIQKEELIDQQQAELKALMEAKGGIKDLAYEFLLTIHAACGSIDAAIKTLGRRGISAFVFNKYVMMTVLGIALILYFYYRPEAGAEIARFMSSPLTLIIVAVVIIAVAYYVWRKR